MEFKAKYDRRFYLLRICYRELYYKQLAAVEFYVFRFGFGVMWSKKVSARSKRAIDTFYDETTDCDN